MNLLYIIVSPQPQLVQDFLHLRNIHRSVQRVLRQAIVCGKLYSFQLLALFFVSSWRRAKTSECGSQGPGCDCRSDSGQSLWLRIMLPNCDYVWIIMTKYGIYMLRMLMPCLLWDVHGLCLVDLRVTVSLFTLDRDTFCMKSYPKHILC